MKQVFSRIFSRVTLVGFFILVQLAALYVGIALLGSRVTYFTGCAAGGAAAGAEDLIQKRQSRL